MIRPLPSAPTAGTGFTSPTKGKPRPKTPICGSSQTPIPEPHWPAPWFPPDYTLKGALSTQWQSDAVPFTATLQAVSPDRSVILTSSKETFEEIRDPIQEKMVARIPVAAPAWLRDFMEPEAYLQQYAEGMLLPSVFGTHLQEEKAKLLAFFNAHAININVRLEVSNLVCDPILSSTAGNMQRRVLALSSGISIS